jgi:MFS family permease
MPDRHLIFVATTLRALATGMLGVLLGLYLARLNYSPVEIGWVLSAGLLGATMGVVAVTMAADRLGRRRALVVLAILSAAGGLAAAVVSDFTVMLAAAFLGMLNGQGRDRGAALVIEQAMLPATTDDVGRTRVYAWYNVLQDVGHGLGSLLAALPVMLREQLGLGDLESFRWALCVYALHFLVVAVVSRSLSPAVEHALPEEKRRLAPESRNRLTRISALFAIDSLAGGFLGSALIAYFFHARFGAGEAELATLFLGARLLNAFSHLGAAWLAARIGLVNTMVFTHIPSSLLLMTVAIAPDFWMAAILFLLREGLVEMDVPTRQSYVMAMVRPEERTFASGVTHLVRLGGWAVGPAFAGLLMQTISLGAGLMVGAAMKIGYDGLLWLSFRRIRPTEEK